MNLRKPFEAIGRIRYWASGAESATGQKRPNGRGHDNFGE
jgi:hypothetical protein